MMVLSNTSLSDMPVTRSMMLLLALATVTASLSTTLRVTGRLRLTGSCQWHANLNDRASDSESADHASASTSMRVASCQCHWQCHWQWLTAGSATGILPSSSLPVAPPVHSGCHWQCQPECQWQVASEARNPSFTAGAT